jgi:hypothetical protein
MDKVPTQVSVPFLKGEVTNGTPATIVSQTRESGPSITLIGIYTYLFPCALVVLPTWLKLVRVKSLANSAPPFSFSPKLSQPSGRLG